MLSQNIFARVRAQLGTAWRAVRVWASDAAFGVACICRPGYRERVESAAEQRGFVRGLARGQAGPFVNAPGGFAPSGDLVRPS